MAKRSLIKTAQKTTIPVSETPKTREFHGELIESEGPITTMSPLNGEKVRGASLIAFSHKELLQRDYSVLSMGLKPSGEIHMGTISTILNGMLYLERHRGSKLKIRVMDQDYDLQRGESFQSFMELPDSNGCHELMKEHTLEKVRNIVAKLSEILGMDYRRVEVSLFTDNYHCTGFAELIMSLIREKERSRGVKRALFDHAGNPYRVPFTPICPECGHSSSKHGRYVSTRDVLKARCRNSECKNHKKPFEVSVSNVLDYNVHFLIDPIRDVYEDHDCSRADLHLFGGDYLWVHGIKKKTRVQRAADVMSVASNELPDFFVGPLLTLNSKKMSKSLGAEAADESVAEHIYTRLAEVLQKNVSPIVEIWDVIVG